jgi:hypothetical protein
MPVALARLLQARQHSESDIQARAGSVYERVLRESRHLRCGNFAAIHVHDLECLWRVYDALFFDGELAQAAADIPVRFRLSRRLTSAAGKTTRKVVHVGTTAARTEYEICVSTSLLFQTFLDVDRPVTASGIPCRDRLEALQRVFEHELVHLSELLVWSESLCAAPRFQSIASRLFGHREHTHQLITQRERAWAKLGLKIGDPVQFRMGDRTYRGLLNRITRRATVLVEDARGTRYTDGKRYVKFYVPLALLARPAASMGG